MAFDRAIGLPPQYDFPLRAIVTGLLVWFLSRPHLDLRPSRPLASIAIGVAVFIIWVGPDVLFGYRHHWLFENSLFGKAEASIAPNLRLNVPFLAIRSAISCL